MRRLAILCAGFAALVGLGSCGSGSTAQAGTTEAGVARLQITVDEQPTGDAWVAVSGIGGRVEPTETIDSATGEAHYAPGQLRWSVIRLTRELPGPESAVVEAWIDESLAGRKPQGMLGIRFHDAAGNETSRWDIERWHVESFEIPPFNAKEGSDLRQTIAVRAEKVLRTRP